MTTIEQKAYAKLNLTLDVLGKRPDGYHDIQSVMQLISLCDDVSLDVGTGEDWKLTCDQEGIPTDGTNLAWKAAGLFYQNLGKDPQGITIRLTKRIPAQAGLGGGSADAAAVLLALNRHEGSPFSQEQLLELAQKLGSDVPFLVAGGTKLAKGRGEVLSDLPTMPQCFYLVVKPDFSVSTPALYQAIDQAPEVYHPQTNAMVQALQKGDLLEVAGYLGNSFEPLVAAEHGEILAIRTVMEDCGALGSAMTGSGSAVFGIFDAFDMAAMASMQLMERYQTFLARNIEEGEV